MKRIIVSGVAAASLLCSCAGNVETPTQELVYKGDTVTVSVESSILSKLEIETLSVEPFSDEFRTVGTAQAENGHYAEVGVPFDGRIARSFVRLGLKVSAGQALFEFSSPEFLEASKEYFQSQKNYEKAKADYDRKKELLSHGISSQRDLEEALTEAENARHDMEYAESTLRVYGADPKSIQMGQSMRIVAPIS
ncbi:MAG: efflux RND transporter periplasmic adaptor subunit, partial [Bacteroidales bacterium]|nr:efflux RND transporter periplasmic adaptor subunit [Bacteroidales bacterium]